MNKRFEIRRYKPTDIKGLRFRIIGLSNKYISFDYKHNYVINHVLEILNDNGYNITEIINVDKSNSNTCYVVLAERW